MFTGEPDPAWHYAQMWVEMREIYFRHKEIEMKLSHPSAKNQNDEVDRFVEKSLIKIWGISNNWIYNFPTTVEPPDTLN